MYLGSLSARLCFAFTLVERKGEAQKYR
jgi:hypothetical protein